MKYFCYLKNGDFNGFYSDDVHAVIPNLVIRITDELWQELLKSNYKIKDISLIEYKIYDIKDIEFFEEVIIEQEEQQPSISLEDRVISLEKENADILLELAIKDIELESIKTDIGDLMLEVAVGGMK